MIKCIEVVGFIPVNCYIYSNDETNHCYIIDPGAEANKIISFIEDNHLIPDKILITHGHFDHIGSVNDLREKYNINAYVFSNEFVENTSYNLSAYYKKIVVENCKIFEQAICLNDGSLPLEIIHTPGHTNDSVLIYSKIDNIAFVGDTIFYNGIGNYTFPTGDRYILLNSIYEKVFALPNDTILYPGHGCETKVKYEKAYHGKK